MGRLPSWGIGWYRRRLDIPASDRGKSIFLDVEGAKAAAKREADARRRVKEGLEAERLLSAEELAAMQPRLTPAPAPPTNVVRMLRRGGALPAIKASPEPEEKDDRAGAAERMRRGMLKLVEDHGLEN